jgi:signal transduction histidine kinase
MNRAEAESSLSSTDQHIRLQAARYFQLAATPEDLDQLKLALRDEDVSWIRLALEDAVLIASGEAAIGALPSQEDELDVPDELYRKALGEATRSLVHEIQPWLGRIRVAAAREVPDYEESDLKSKVDGLADLVNSMNRLRQATAAPRMEEFDLGEWIKSVVREEVKASPIDAEYAGPEHMVIVGDPRLLHVVLCNSVRNAVEATLEVHDSPEFPAILVSWGDTDRDVWVAVSDRGMGPPPGRHHVFGQGRTTKAGHLGMGLAIADAAIKSLSGDIRLKPRRHAEGATLEFRWPKNDSLA